MKIAVFLISGLMFLLSCQSVLSQRKNTFKEKKGFVTVEAEHFAKQDKTNLRQWYLVSAQSTPSIQPDGDESHSASASGKAYLEILPDTRRTHDDPLLPGENFSGKPGEMGVLSYQVKFRKPGRYYLWAKAYSSGSEDNGLHVGLDGNWPESGQRMQWCEGKNSWRWESKQRTEANHCGEPYLIFLDIQNSGVHTIQFSMREDGFEFDKFMLTTNRDFVPQP